MTTAKQSGRRDEWSHGNYSAASISGDTDDLHSRLHFRRLQICATIFFGLLVGVLHYYHVGTLYENDRYFSHLSNLEREMCFRSEMGLYYSFYKRLTLSSSLRDGVTALIRDNTTEFPDTINALSKFNIYPEIFTAGVFNLYQHFLYVMDWSGKECYTIQRGNGLSPIESCVGLGEPVYFYLEVVWIFAGLVAFLLFFYGTLISGSILGGCVTILCFAINHAECTRVQWTPPLRESFAYPMILLHCLMVTSILQQNPRKQATGQTFFGSFPEHSDMELMGYLLALVGLMGNQLVLFSFLTAVLISAWLLLVYYHKFNQRTFMCRSLIRIVLVTTVSMLLKMSFPFTGNDSHIIKIFLSKVFGNVKDFHTLMYTCAPEFQGLPWSYGLNLTISLLIPLLTIVFLIISTSLLRELSNLKLTKNQRALQTLLHKSNHPSILFNISLLLIYFLLSMMAMRLKLFLSPQLCILVSLICSEKIARLIPFVRERTKWQYPLLFAIVAVLSFHSLYSIKKQHNVLGEYYNEPLEELLSWTKTKTNEKDVFAGPMPVMANILLSTGRPIVNHPYYEDEKTDSPPTRDFVSYRLRKLEAWGIGGGSILLRLIVKVVQYGVHRVRTVLAYSVFSRKSAYEAFEALTFLKANYVVLEASKCFDSPNSRKECKMTDLWDLEDPKNSERPPLCPQLFYGDESPFLRVFQNEEYVVLSIRSA